jgi:hypothetical protein
MPKQHKCTLHKVTFFPYQYFIFLLHQTFYKISSVAFLSIPFQVLTCFALFASTLLFHFQFFTFSYHILHYSAFLITDFCHMLPSIYVLKYYVLFCFMSLLSYFCFYICFYSNRPFFNTYLFIFFTVFIMSLSSDLSFSFSSSPSTFSIFFPTFFFR